MIVVMASILAACEGGPVTPAVPAAGPTADPALAALERQRARFAPVDLRVDLSALPARERQALAHLVRAAQVLDGVFLRQVWAGSEAVLFDLLRDDSPLGRARLDYFLLNKGPWSRLDGDTPFLDGVPARPGGADFYPPDATREEVAAWIAALAPADRAAATGFFTTIRRGPDGRLLAVPYSLEYQGELAVAAGHLREAARVTAESSLAAFLDARAAAFLSNEYYESDVKWMELTSAIEPTIGPYEVYEDQWFNYKAAFEAFITVKDAAESARLARFAAHLQEIENHLPIDPRFRNPSLGAMAPIAVVNLVFGAGDANSGVQAAAFNLPNDERVLREKGSKRVMLKNNQEAKFAQVLVPISRVALPPADRSRVSFDAFFTHILMHELMHGLGPHAITAGGRATTVRQELREAYSPLEEAKADISGLFALQFLIDRGELDRALEDTMYTTFLASAFRSIRFGITGAHGRGQAIQLNYLLDRGAVVVQADGTFRVEVDRIRDAVRDLARDILTVQAMGDYRAARELIDRLGVIRPEVQAVLDRLVELPVDIAPRFVTADELLAER